MFSLFSPACTQRAATVNRLRSAHLFSSGTEQLKQNTTQRTLETEVFIKKTLYITLDTKTVSRDIPVVIVNKLLSASENSGRKIIDPETGGKTVDRTVDTVHSTQNTV